MKFNKSNPAIRSPVSGIVENAGQGDYGTISIRDADGYLHQILHTHRRHVNVGDPVVAGQLIGTMGNSGVKTRGVEDGDTHVHYQLFDSRGNRVNPMEYWDQQGPIDPKPAPPADLDDYQQYLATPGAAMGNADIRAPRVGPRYGSQAIDPADAAVATQSRKTMRVLSARVVPRTDLGGYDANAPTTVPNQASSPDRPPSFDERFGNWVSSPSATAPLNPYQPVAPPPQADRPLGIIPGQRVPGLPFPPSTPADRFDNPRSQVWPIPQKYRSSAATDVPPSTPASFEIPGSHFGRLLTNTAHLVPDAWQPSAQAASPPSAPSVPIGPDRQGSFNNQSNLTSSQAPAPKLDLTSPSSAALLSPGAGVA